LVINQETIEIICTAFGLWHCHDFNLFKKSKIYFHSKTNSLQDSGYQGIKDYHPNTYLPRKKPKNGKLSRIEKDYKRVLAQEQIIIEHVNRSLKILKILSSRYRNRRRRYAEAL
jgi:DDE superfamily endonuclease